MPPKRSKSTGRTGKTALAETIAHYGIDKLPKADNFYSTMANILSDHYPDLDKKMR